MWLQGPAMKGGAMACIHADDYCVTCSVGIVCWGWQLYCCCCFHLGSAS
jgi:hypothetical protein